MMVKIKIRFLVALFIAITCPINFAFAYQEGEVERLATDLKNVKQYLESGNENRIKEVFCNASLFGNRELVEYIMDETSQDFLESKLLNNRVIDIAIANAASSGNLELVNILYKKGGNVNVIIYEYQNAFMNAISFRNADIVEFMLSNGADITSENVYGISAYRLAYSSITGVSVNDEAVEIFKMLVEKGANPKKHEVQYIDRQLVEKYLRGSAEK
ncbi:MAG TPA: ankyrin repeat domain-containing protein [Gammaproteobacteria bacterium]